MPAVLDQRQLSSSCICDLDRPASLDGFFALVTPRGPLQHAKKCPFHLSEKGIE
jgi:hypothetical protein